ALDVTDELPCGALREHRAPCRHTLGTPMHDGKIDLRRLASVDPGVIAQRRAHPAATHWRVASTAVEGRIMLFARGDGVRISLVRIANSRIQPRCAWKKFGYRYVGGVPTRAWQPPLGAFCCHLLRGFRKRSQRYSFSAGRFSAVCHVAGITRCAILAAAIGS